MYTQKPHIEYKYLSHGDPFGNHSKAIFKGTHWPHFLKLSKCAPFLEKAWSQLGTYMNLI